MKNKTNNVTSHIGKKLLVLGIITVYLCMATACGTNKNNNNSGSMAASPSQWQQTQKDLSVMTVAGAQLRDHRASSGAVHGSVQHREQITQA